MNLNIVEGQSRVWPKARLRKGRARHEWMVAWKGESACEHEEGVSGVSCERGLGYRREPLI